MRNAAIAPAALLVTLIACSPRQETPEATGTASEAAAAAAALALPFVENDFSAALTRAKEAQLPLFVEVWAPW